jgi:manganese oxidase
MGRATFAILIASAFAAAASAAAPAGSPTSVIVPNDNRAPAGALAHGVLRISIDTRTGLWYPDGPHGVDLPVEAFGEYGRPLQIPGPVIRVPLGTTVLARVRNSVPGTVLSLHGFADRPGAGDRPIDLRYGQERTVRFRALAPGTYFYWGTTTKNAIANRTKADSPLSGAIVIDDPRSRWNSRNDRIFVVDEWDGVRTKSRDVDFDYELNAINGVEYPSTEHLIYPIGTLVHWRVINTSWQDHPLHLHGFYFAVDSRGDGLHDTVYPAGTYHDRRVTELVPAGTTRAYTWRAARAGNWLFHCHISYHTTSHAPFSKMGDEKYNDAYDRAPHMGGLVMRVTVKPKPGMPAAASMGPVQRRLRLTVEPTARDAPDVPAFRYVVEENGVKTVASGAMGPPIVLTRDQTVDITVTNRLAEPTAVHWHGIELEDSYYDGVPKFSGYGNRREPMIMPGESFDVRFAPPRAGTFIYHAHMNDAWQVFGGLSGPLIVLPAGVRFDSATDHIIEMSTPRDFKQFNGISINGMRKPAAITVAAGVAQRFRFINVTMLDSEATISLASARGPALWKPLAVDGADLPAALRLREPAVGMVTIGQTRDFLFEPRVPGEYKLMFWAAPGGRLRMTIPIHVIATALGKLSLAGHAALNGSAAR